jgi:hypothetical protein
MNIYIFFNNGGGKPKWPTSRKLGKRYIGGGNKQIFPEVKKNEN